MNASKKWLLMLTLITMATTADAHAITFVRGAVYGAANGRIFPVAAEVNVVDSQTNRIVATMISNNTLWLGKWVTNGYDTHVRDGRRYSVYARYYHAASRRWLTASAVNSVNANGGIAVVNLTVR